MPGAACGVRTLPGVLRGDEFNVVATMLDDCLWRLSRVTPRETPTARPSTLAPLPSWPTWSTSTPATSRLPAPHSPQTRHGRTSSPHRACARRAERAGGIAGRGRRRDQRAGWAGAQDVGAETNHLFEFDRRRQHGDASPATGLDPQYIAQAPYIPVVSQPLTLYASDLRSSRIGRAGLPCCRLSRDSWAPTPSA